ncbi:MAG: enoyl-CoA hydratase/isomerase family protein [Sphingomonadales bacterium]|nr:enoyl-CoA hydratase/isomerase family protein [Sphingomonadales bacterium]
MALIELTRSGAVACLAFNRPEKRNATTLPMQVLLRDALATVAADGAVRALVITGHGSDFCVGGDFEVSRRIAAEPAHAITATARHHDTIAALLALQIPVIAAIEGAALGFGAEVVACCDHVVMGDSAWLADPHVPMGLAPAPVLLLLWPRLAGAAVAHDLLQTGRKVPAAEALTLSLAHAVTPAGTALAAAMALATGGSVQPRLPRPTLAELDPCYPAGVLVEAPGLPG